MEYTIIKQRPGINPSKMFVKSIMDQFQLSELSATFLCQKGLTTIGQVEEYLFPKYDYLINPLFFNDMDKITHRIRQAVNNHEKIVVYGDYDCDGVCASVILYKTLLTLGGEVECFLPNRFTDGYGLNLDSIKRLIDKGTDLIITVDNGITACEEIAFAKTHGIDVIITDHHIASKDQPNAYAILNPKLSGESYPYSDLSGAGVALKLAQALDPLHTTIDEYLTFAAIATIADIVPLTGENRIITSLGLKNIAKCNNLGLQALMKKASIDPYTLSSGQVAFQLAPRINASGRLYSAYEAFELFVTSNIEDAERLAAKIDAANNERKSIETDILEKSEQYIKEHNLLETSDVLFVPLTDVNEGVIGIVAGKLCEKYHKPAIVGNQKKGILKASARSIPSIDIHEALSTANELFINFGGHKQAAGFTLNTEHFSELTERVNVFVRENELSQYNFKSVLYDIESLSIHITEKSVREINMFAPYGLHNPHPVYKLENVAIRNLRLMGKNNEHVRCNIVHKSCNFNAVAFSMGSLGSFSNISDVSFDVLFTPSINNFRNKEELQLQIKALMPHIEYSDEYYESLYDHFNFYSKDHDIYTPNEDQFINKSLENIIDIYPKSVITIHQKDNFIRALRYCAHINKDVSIHFGRLADLVDDKINLFVNPYSKDLNCEESLDEIVVDQPYFTQYSKNLYKKQNHVLFRKVDNVPFTHYIDRRFLACIYKKLRELDIVGQNITEFLSLINQNNEYEVNYFTLRISLDIMSEVGILDYEIIEEKLFIEFKQITEQKDINKSDIMIKLMSNA